MYAKAEHVSTAALNRKESERLILKIAHQKGWAWWYDDDGKLIVDVSDSTKKGVIMKNGWTPAPANPNDLPWPIKAGKRVQWWVKWEAFDKWTEKEFVYIGSIKEVGDYNDPRYKEKTIISDKIAEGGGIYYKEGLIIAYKDCDAGPF